VVISDTVFEGCDTTDEFPAPAGSITVAGRPGPPEADVDSIGKGTSMEAPFVWFDLAVAGGDEVGKFYQDLLGWQLGPGAGDYHGWFTTADGQPWAGIRPAGAQGVGWVPYVVVGDLDASTERAVGLGGRVVQPRTEGPAGTSVLVADPGGAVVALFVPAG
jgi:predicted enzyme related to lactoylglutathione lyase